MAAERWWPAAPVGRKPTRPPYGSWIGCPGSRRSSRLQRRSRRAVGSSFWCCAQSERVGALTFEPASGHFLHVLRDDLHRLVELRCGAELDELGTGVNHRRVARAYDIRITGVEGLLTFGRPVRDGTLLHVPKM